MTLQQNLKLAAYLLALIGLWAVTFTDYFSFVWPVASTALVLSSWFYKGAPKYEHIIKRFWLAGGLLMVLFFPFDLVLSRSLLLTAVHITIFVQAYSLLNPKSEKVYRRILLVSCFQILASTNLTTDLRFGVFITAYCAVAIYFVLLLHLFDGMTSDQNPESVVQEKAPQGIFVFSLMLAAVMLPLSLTFFYSMPRLRYAIIARGNPIDSMLQMREARQRTGFTKTVELGTYGRIQEDQTLALRVEIPEGRPLTKNVKWRGGALNIYDGVVWSSSRDYFQYFDGKYWRVTDKNLGMTFARRNSLFIVDEAYVVENQAELDADPLLLKQVVYLEIPYSDTLFGGGEIKAVEGPFTYGIGRDFNDSFYIGNRQALPDLMSYTTYSFVNQPAPEALRRISAAEIREFVTEGNYNYVRKSFLQLPTSLNPQVRQLAEQITQNADTPYDKVKAIEEFLVSRYTYSLDLEKPMTDDPLYDFLFLSRTGHCEYFATAMTIMCRAIGIPARLAKGFQQGEWNDVGRFYEVRQKDSHAWVEALFPQYGWVEFDPSPRAVADEYFTSRRSLVSRWMSKRLLQLQIFWRQNVVGYNETTRLRLITQIKDWLRESLAFLVAFFPALRDSIKSLSVTRLLFAFVTLLVAPVLIYLLRKFRNWLPRRLRSLRPPKRDSKAPAFYGKMLKLLRKRKILKPAHLTPREFLDTPLLRRHPQLNEIELITSLYYRNRYGGAELSDADAAAIQTALATLRRNGHASGAASTKN